jgi:hypothetical protein
VRRDWGVRNDAPKFPRFAEASFFKQASVGKKIAIC